MPVTGKVSLVFCNPYKSIQTISRNNYITRDDLNPDAVKKEIMKFTSYTILLLNVLYVTSLFTDIKVFPDIYEFVVNYDRNNILQ